MKRTFTRLALLGAVLLLIIPVASAESVSEEEFSIDLPSWCGQATKQEQQIESPSGPIDVVTYLAKGDDGAACIVTYSELSGPITDSAGTIESSRDSLLQQLNVDVEGEKDIKVSGFEGRSINFMTADPRPIFGRTDLVVADDRLYQVIYIGFTAEARDKIQDSSLFTSLEILSPEPAETEAVAEAPDAAAAQTESASNNDV
ncbi:MAG: hypothetical protein R3338_10650 [Thermoanaerobaculia bacterium]|nr:hypothetical protein [Thermoanaerobaculia bacterium]